MTRANRTAGPIALVIIIGMAVTAAGELRVQDIARLQGQRTNRLMGYGLVVGLNGTGDGGNSAPTMRALIKMHERFHQPVLALEELEDVTNVAIVTVEAEVPEFGAREGEMVNVTVSAFSAESLKGGQLLTTPLQYVMFDPANPATQQVYALAGGRIDLPDASNPRRGVIRDGGTFEADFYYNFVLDGAITLVLDDEHAGYTWSQLVARVINHEISNPNDAQAMARRGDSHLPAAVAIGPKNIRVRVPDYELARPAGYISRVLQAVVFATPKQQAIVCINRATGNISFTGNVTISPTVLQIPNLGTIAVGAGESEEARVGDAKAQQVAFQELLSTLSKLQLGPAETVQVVEHLHKTGTLHAKLIYTE